MLSPAKTEKEVSLFVGGVPRQEIVDFRRH